MPRNQIDLDSPTKKIIVKNTLLNFVGQLIPIIVAVFGVPVLIRYLGVERFGILSILWLLMWYSTMLDLGLGRATTRFVADAIARKEYDKISKIVWTSILVQVIIGIVLMFIFSLLTPLIVERFLKINPKLVPEVKTSFYILSFSISIILLSTSFQGLLEAYQRFDLVNFVLTPVKIGVLLVSVVGAIFALSLDEIMLLLVAMRILTIAVLFLLSLKVCPEIKSFFNFDLFILPKLFSFGWWITLINIVNPILVYVDRFLIGAILSTGVLAYYTAPFEIIQRLWIVPTSVMMTLFPTFSALSGARQNEEIVGILTNAIKFTFAILFPIVFILSFFSFEFLEIWLGHEFAQRSSYVFKIIAFGILVNSIAGFPAILLQGVGRPDITAKVYFTELIFYVPLVSFFIYKFGILGAAIGWLIRQVVDLILLYLILLKQSFLPSTQFFSSKNFVLLFAFVVLYFVTFISGLLGFIAKVLIAICSLTVLSLFIWFKIFNESDRGKLRMAFKK